MATPTTVDATVLRPALQELCFAQNTPEWFAARRKFSASWTSVPVGLSRFHNVMCEWDWDVNHVGEEKPRGDESHARRGHLNEGSTAAMVFEILFPAPEKVLVGKNAAQTKLFRQPGNRDGIRTCGIFLHPDYPDLISASPDRILEGHPDRSQTVGVEIKDKDAGLPKRPEVEHLCQNHNQMACLKANYLFLAYAFKRRNCLVYLVEFEPRFWEWILERFWLYKRCVDDQVPPVMIHQIAYAVLDYWNEGKVHQEIKQRFPKQWQKPNFWPPQPRWQLVGYHLYPGDMPADYESKIIRRSQSGPVSPHIMKLAVGSLREPLSPNMRMSHLVGCQQMIASYEQRLRRQLTPSDPRLLAYDECVVELLKRTRSVVFSEIDKVTKLVTNYYEYSYTVLGIHARYFLHYRGIDEKLGLQVHDSNAGGMVWKDLCGDWLYFVKLFQDWFSWVFPQSHALILKESVPEDEVCVLYRELFSVIVEALNPLPSTASEAAKCWWDSVPLDK